jgi:predicted nucleic acid-binding protein
VVRTLFDTSVLVAAFVATHPRHSVCLKKLQQVKAGQTEGFIAAHTLAETYSVLTRLPVRPPISPKLAQQLIRENLEGFEVISLSPSDYQVVIAQMVNLNLPGGAIYDALIAQAALRAKVEQLMTLNPDHFTRLSEEIAQLVLLPHA